MYSYINTMQECVSLESIRECETSFSKPTENHVSRIFSL